ncbi:hypothetical protein Tco_1362533 [Tanacetum coccineum]
MLTGKWTLTNRDVRRFISFVNKTKALSGENDEDFMSRVEILYKTVEDKDETFGTKKNSEVSRKVMSSTNPFDALDTIEEGDELGSDDEGKPLKLSKLTLPSSSNVVSKKVDDFVNEYNDSEVEEVYDETVTYMTSTSFNDNKDSKSGSGGGNKILYEQWKEIHGEDPYDDYDFDDPGLTDAQTKFANALDINLHESKFDDGVIRAPPLSTSPLPSTTAVAYTHLSQIGRRVTILEVVRIVLFMKVLPNPVTTVGDWEVAEVMLLEGVHKEKIFR